MVRKRVWEDILTQKGKWSLDWFGSRAYKEFRKYIDKKDKKVLDAGFGSGRFCLALAKDFPQSEIYGIDISPELVANANQLASNFQIKNVHFMKDDIFNLSFPDKSFDVVFNQGVIEHFTNHEDAFKEMYRVTKQGGTIIVGVPNWYNFIHTIRKWLINKTNGEYEYGYEKSFKHKELMYMFEKYHLKDIKITGYYSMQSIIRLSGFGRCSKLFLYLGTGVWGKWIEKFIIIPIDKLIDNRISKKFGYEIVIKGVK